MTGMSATELLDRIIHLMRTRGFVIRHTLQSKGINYKYGSSGLLLKRNITRAWWEWMVTSQERTYPVESGMYDHNDKVNGMRRNLSYGCIEHYPEVVSLTNRTLPFSIAQTGVCFHQTSQEQEQNFIFDSSVQTELLLQHYCNPARHVQSFDQCVTRRLQWWRKFADNPGDFSDEEVKETSNGASQVNITYPFPWGKDVVESISNKGVEPLKELEGDTKHDLTCKLSKKAGLPCVVECSTGLERGMLAFILDAYKEKTSDTSASDEPRKFLELHNALAPYSVSIATDSKVTSDMKIVVDHISKEIREAGITILDVADDNCPLDEQLKRNDEMGIPFTAVVDRTTMMDGRIHIRFRDTLIKEQIHITGLTDFLKKQTRETEPT